jgi:hypothetical protein
MSDIIKSIFDFCKVRNLGPVYKNGKEKTPRVNFIISLLEKEGIKYEVDEFETGFGESIGFNIIMRGESNKMFIAHHDIVNPDSDNANDNSASVINAIYLKSILPHLNVVLTDGEEYGFLGAKRVSDQIIGEKFGEIEWVLNLELTGRGGENFFIGDYPGNLSQKIKEKFNPPTMKTPGNDCIPLISSGIDAAVINPLPLLEEGTSLLENERGFLQVDLLKKCHSKSDNIENISIDDMKKFVEKILVPISDL